MDEVIKQELWRSAGVFWVAIGLSLGIMKAMKIVSGFILLGMAFIITLIISSSFIIIRNKRYKGTEVVSLIIGFLLINLVVLTTIFFKFYMINIITTLVGVIAFIYGLIKLSKK